jgi:hypothetical protein
MNKNTVSQLNKNEPKPNMPGLKPYKPPKLCVYAIKKHVQGGNPQHADETEGGAIDAIS